MRRKFGLFTVQLAVYFAASVAAADDVTVGSPVQVSIGSTTAQEISAVASFGSPQRIVAVWQERQEGLVPEGFIAKEVSRIMASVSQDGGQSWTQFPIRPPNPDPNVGEGDPMSAYDPVSGYFWAGGLQFNQCGAGGTGNGVVYTALWDPNDPGTVPFGSASEAHSGCRFVDKGLMVAGRNETSAGTTRLYISFNLGLIRSDDGGTTWSSPPVPIVDTLLCSPPPDPNTPDPNTPDPSTPDPNTAAECRRGQGHVPRIAQDGTLYIAYWYGPKYLLARSGDGGFTFTVETIADRKACCDPVDCPVSCDCTATCWSTSKANSLFPGGFRVSPFLGFAIHPVNDTLYAVYMDLASVSGNEANIDLYFSKSFDAGSSWTDPVVINSEGPNTGDQFMPWLEVDAAGRLHVVFFDTRNTLQQDSDPNALLDTYYAYSEDDGSTWHEIPLTSVPWNSAIAVKANGDQFIGDYLAIAVTDNVVWPFYPVGVVGAGATRINTRRISFTTPGGGEPPGTCGPGEVCNPGPKRKE